MVANQNTNLSNQTQPLDALERQAALLALAIASTTFVKQTEDQTELWAASRDWFFEPWGRDTFISMPGLLLTTRRFAEAREVFTQFASFEKDGLIPNRITTDEILYNTVDASLWFVIALEKYQQVTGDTTFVKTMWPTVERIIKHYQTGTYFNHFGQKHFIGADTDGLMISPAQATWMDADPSGTGETIITPRNGKAVEINALWYAVLLFAGEEKAALKVKKSFNAKFWNQAETCLFDVIEGDPHQGAIRPNQIIALSHGKNLLGKIRQRQVLATVTAELLTPGGLRTLSPRDSNYQGTYNTQAPIAEKDYAYHQGTAWPWLLGPYVDALFNVRIGQGKYEAAVKTEALEALSPLLKFILDSPYQSLPEVFSGDSPYDPGGTTSQAWSVAEVLRVLVEYDLVYIPEYLS